MSPARAERPPGNLLEARELRATIEIAMRRGQEGRAARARESRLYELLTLLGDAVARVEEGGRFSRLNAAAERLLGRTEAEIVAAGLRAGDLLGGEGERATLRPPFGDAVEVRVCRLPVSGPSGPAELLVFHDPKSSSTARATASGSKSPTATNSAPLAP